MILRFYVAALPLVFFTSCVHQSSRHAVTQQHPAAVPTMMRRQVLNAVDAGEGDTRIRLLRERMAADPDNAAIRLELAALYKAAGFPELALEHYRLAAERFPGDERVVARLAEALSELGQKKEATALLAKHLASASVESPDLYAWLGILRDAQGDYTAAAEAHRHALQLSPNNAKFHNNLGYNLLLRGNGEEAVKSLRMALSLDPKLDAARNNLGLALARAGGEAGRQEAMALWQAANGGDKAAAHTNMAAVLMEQARYDEARAELQLALAQNRSYAPAWSNLAMLERIDGKPLTMPLSQSASQQASSQASGLRRTFRQVWNFVAGIDEKQSGTTRLNVASRD